MSYWEAEMCHLNRKNVLVKISCDRVDSTGQERGEGRIHELPVTPSNLQTGPSRSLDAIEDL